MKKIEEPTEKECKILLLKLKALRTDEGTQSRARLNNDTAERYAKDMQDGCKFPCMEVFRGVDDRTPDDPKIYDWLSRGHHRWHAYDKNGVKEEWCKVYEGSRRDAILHSVSDNADHGLQRTPEDKRHAVRLLLDDEEWWERTNVWVAEKCHVNDKMVANVREEMEAKWKLQEEAEAKAAAEAEAKGETDGESSPRANRGQAKPREGRGNRSRKGRSRHGGTRMINVEACAAKGKGGDKIKPVRREREIQQLAKLEAQLVRSPAKYVRQALAAGWSEAKMVSIVVELARSIPVVEAAV